MLTNKVAWGRRAAEKAAEPARCACGREVSASVHVGTFGGQQVCSGCAVALVIREAAVGPYLYQG